jgi:hypothetical protein
VVAEAHHHHITDTVAYQCTTDHVVLDFDAAVRGVGLAAAIAQIAAGYAGPLSHVATVEIRRAAARLVELRELWDGEAVTADG